MKFSITFITNVAQKNCIAIFRVDKSLRFLQLKIKKFKVVKPEVVRSAICQKN